MREIKLNVNSYFKLEMNQSSVRKLHKCVCVCSRIQDESLKILSYFTGGGITSKDAQKCSMFFDKCDRYQEKAEPFRQRSELYFLFHWAFKFDHSAVGYTCRLHKRQCNNPLAAQQSGPWRRLSVEKLRENLCDQSPIKWQL